MLPGIMPNVSVHPKPLLIQIFFSLYKASPANADDAAENYRQMFEDPNRAMNEVIFLKGYTLVGAELGSNQDNWGNLNQTRGHGLIRDVLIPFWI